MKRFICLILAVAAGGVLLLPASAAQQPSQTPPAGQSGKPSQQPPAAPPATFTLPEPGEIQPVTTISFGGGELIKAFNASADRARLVLVFSPT